MENIFGSLVQYIEQPHYCMILKEIFANSGSNRFLTKTNIIENIGLIDDIIWFVLDEIKKKYEFSPYKGNLLLKYDPHSFRKIVLNFKPNKQLENQLEIASFIKAHLLEKEETYISYGSMSFHLMICIKTNKPRIPNIPYPKLEEEDEDGKITPII